MRRFSEHGLATRCRTAFIRRRASARPILREMGIKPWRQIQPDFDPEIIGAIMSSYFGGRAEIHRRREIVQTLYTDFASMYPTVCTLMGLWRFVIAPGMTHEDATADTQAFLDRVTVADLKRSETWRELRVLVQVVPDADIFPVRARYGSEPMPPSASTISPPINRSGSRSPIAWRQSF